MTTRVFALVSWHWNIPTTILYTTCRLIIFVPLLYSNSHSRILHLLVIIWLKSEKAMATHSSTLAWEISWMEEPGRLQSMGLLRVGWPHFHFSLSCIGEGNGNPLQCSYLENPRDGGAWWAAVYGLAQSHTRLKRLSRSSSSSIWLKWPPLLDCKLCGDKDKVTLCSP